MYNITLGQLITVWVFGFIGWFLTLAPALDNSSTMGLFFMVFIPFALVFYTIGWSQKRKKSKSN